MEKKSCSAIRKQQHTVKRMSTICQSSWPQTWTLTQIRSVSTSHAHKHTHITKNCTFLTTHINWDFTDPAAGFQLASHSYVPCLPLHPLPLLSPHAHPLPHTQHDCRRREHLRVHERVRDKWRARDEKINGELAERGVQCWRNTVRMKIKADCRESWRDVEGKKNNGQYIGDWMKWCGGLGVWWRNMSRLSQTHTKCSCHTHMVTEHMAFSQSWRQQKTNPYHSKTMVQFSKQRPYSVPDSSCWELVGYWSWGRGTVTWWTSFFLASWSWRQCRPGLFSARTHLKHTHSLIWQNAPLYPVSWC